MDPHNKRAKGNWQQGKRYKGDSSERQFSKREAKQQLAEDEENYLERHHKGKRTRNEKARLEYRVQWYAQALERSTGGQSWDSYLRSGLNSARAKLTKLAESK